VLLEFAVNDGHNNEGSLGSVEGIVRRITAQRGGGAARAAIALVSWCATHAPPLPTSTRGCSRERPGTARALLRFDNWPQRPDRPPHEAEWKVRWDHSAEDIFAEVTQYYDVSSLSLRDALMLEARPTCRRASSALRCDVCACVRVRVHVRVRAMDLLRVAHARIGACVLCVRACAGHAQHERLFVLRFRNKLEPCAPRTHACRVHRIARMRGFLRAPLLTPARTRPASQTRTSAGTA
jgi:hypothetical protein